jgi:hypothetical protein
MQYQEKRQQTHQLFQSDHQPAKQQLTGLYSVLAMQRTGTCWFPFPNGVLFPWLLLVDHLMDIEKSKADGDISQIMIK